MPGLQIVMDLGWIVTFVSENEFAPQINFVSEDGSGARAPNLTIGVDNLDATYERMRKAGYKIEYELATEPWGVRGFL